MTMRPADAPLVIPWAVPLTAKVKIPSGVVADVLTVMVGVPGGAGLGEKLQLAPSGRPLHDRVTGTLKPPVSLMKTA